MAINFLKKIANEAVIDGVKKFGKDTAKDIASDIGTKLIKDGATEVSNNISISAKKATEEKNEINNKYIRLRKLLILTDSNFKNFIEGIEEVENMIVYYNHELATLIKYNPAFLIKKNSLTSQQKKWITLKLSLSNELTKKLYKECLKTFRTKAEATFFSEHSNINTEILDCKSEKEVKKLYHELFERYNVKRSINSSDPDSYRTLL